MQPSVSHSCFPFLSSILFNFICLYVSSSLSSIIHSLIHSFFFILISFLSFSFHHFNRFFHTFIPYILLCFLFFIALQFFSLPSLRFSFCHLSFYSSLLPFFLHASVHSLIFDSLRSDSHSYIFPFFTLHSNPDYTFIPALFHSFPHPFYKKLTKMVTWSSVLMSWWVNCVCVFFLLFTKSSFFISAHKPWSRGKHPRDAFIDR